MRKVMMWLLSFMIAVAVSPFAHADETYLQASPVLEYEGPCPHEFCSYGRVLLQKRGVSGFLASDEEYVTAICIYCERTHNVKVTGEIVTGKVEDAATCVHHFYRCDVLEQGWYPAGNVYEADDDIQSVNRSPLHEYRTYYLCRCMYCKTTIRMYEGQIVNGVIPERHSYVPLEETLVHAHIPGENLHVFVRTCEVCGYFEAEQRGCGQLNNGLCTVMLNSLLQEQGCADHTSEERNMCSRCK